MVKDSKYVIVSVEDFNSFKDQYISEGFVNRGAVRLNLAQTQVLLEEDPTWVERAQADSIELIWEGTEDEIQQYLSDNKVDWEEEMEENI